MALVGVYWKNRAKGLILEQLGLVLVGVMSLGWVACAIYYQGWGAGLPGAIVGGFGLSCLRRYFQLQQIINAVEREEQRRNPPRGR
jgi:hypothetical protein